MMRFFAPAIAVMLMTGCRAPTPSFDLFAPGTTRIPPPGTGSYGSPDSYYRTPTQPPPGAVGSGLQSRRSAPQAVTAASDESQTTADTMVVNSDYETATDDQPDGTLADAKRIRVVAAPTTSSVRPQLKGMPVSGVTSPAEPAPFRPPARVIDISQLPKPAPRSTGGTSSAISESSSTAAPTRSQAVDRTGWQSREKVSTSVRIAGR